MYTRKFCVYMNSIFILTYSKCSRPIQAIFTKYKDGCSIILKHQQKLQNHTVHSCIATPSVITWVWYYTIFSQFYVKWSLLFFMFFSHNLFSQINVNDSCTGTKPRKTAILPTSVCYSICRLNEIFYMICRLSFGQGEGGGGCCNVATVLLRSFIVSLQYSLKIELISLFRNKAK